MSDMTDLSTAAAEELHDVTVYVNGVARTARVPARRLLSDFLRHDLELTGTHVGCEHGVCGACTASMMQERTARPFQSTVHAPHTPCSQPTWVPVSRS